MNCDICGAPAEYICRNDDHLFCKKHAHTACPECGDTEHQNIYTMDAEDMKAKVLQPA